MAGLWTDLLSGKAPTASVPLFSGQWAVAGSVSSVRINGVDALSGDRLVADRRQRWSAEASGFPHEEQDLPKVRPVPAEDFDALVRMEESLGELPKLDATWLDWADASPLAPRIEDEIRIRAFDEFLEERLLFLEAVCRSPRNHLRIDADLQPVSRARRIAKQAVARLASHREDWERPTVLGVRPKRVLCLVPEEEVDLYENRVAARLVDHLRSYLANRLLRLGGVLRMIAESDHSDNTSGAYWRQRQRLFSIWGEAIKDESATRIASATQRRLEALHLRVLALLDSVLYESVPRSAQITGLRFTNIFLNDPNYRQVAAIYREWAKAGHDKVLGEQERFRREQRACRGMALFARVVVARALRQLGLAPTRDAMLPLTGDRPKIQLDGVCGMASVQLEEEGAILVAAGSSRIRIVPLVTTNELAGEVGQAQAVETDIIPSDGEHVLLLHLPSPIRSGDASEGDLPFPSTLLPAWAPNQPDGLRASALPISPWSILSVECVARFLRWHLYTTLLAQYPPEVAFDNPPPSTQSRWLAAAGTNRWKILRHPHPQEDNPESLTKRLAAAEHKRLTSQGGKIAQRARQDADAAADEMRSALEQGFEALARFELCPVCGEAHGVLVPLDNEGKSFRVLCQSCDATWGCVACGGRKSSGEACGDRVPFIAVQGFEEWLKTKVALPRDWAEVRFGADLLAIPQRDPSGKPRWLCSACAVTSVTGSATLNS
jgi:hypothetical protein